MDRASITVCRIYAALNNVLTTNLTDDELLNLENKIIEDIMLATNKKSRAKTDDIKDLNNKISSAIAKEDDFIKSSDSYSENAVDENKHQRKENSDDAVQEQSKTKRVRWDCKSCMNVSFKDIEGESVCSMCKKAFEDSQKTNTYYQRRPKEVPSCCGSCNYIKYDEEIGKYLCTVNYYDENTNKITANVVRANYMNKNKPTFCRI